MALITAADLKRARKLANETQAQFAARFGVDRSTYTGWESGKVPTEGTAPVLIERILAELCGKTPQEAAE
jgi:transcriptional regulator with XRE-family HTH domain